MADPASFATSCATRVTRAIGAGTRDERLFPDLLLLADRDALDLPAAAFRVDVLPAALRFMLEPLLVDEADRPEDALRVLVAPAADLPRELVLLDLFLFALFDEALLPDFPRDFFALVAIVASPRSRGSKTTSTIARIRHIRKSKNRSQIVSGRLHFARRDESRSGGASSRCLAPLRAIQSSRPHWEHL